MSDSSQPQSQSGTSHIQPTSSSEGLFEHYAPLPNTWDDYFEPTGAPRAPTTTVAHFLDRLGAKAFRERQTLADRTFLRGGITFSVYNDTKGVEKIFPFDLIPRIVTAAEWSIIESGLIQRIEALNAFLLDVYSDQRILHEGVVPRHMVESSQGFLKPMMGVRPPGGNHMFVSGIDLIRGPDGDFMVLEDNVRTPSGVSYVMENRNVMQQVMHDLCSTVALVPVQDYPLHLREALASISPRAPEETQIVVLTPGPYNSAYFEHGFLARSMGCPLVQPQDLFVHDHRVYVKTTRGPQRVDVIYRRVDDDFIDPDVFRPDSLLGVRGLVEAYARGHVTLGNALGNGVADDKATYPYVPDMIRFYLGQEPILSQVPTWVCDREADRTYVLEHLGELVVKAVDASGGYGMLMGPQASRAELDTFAERIRANPRGYIAQPRIELSTSPTWVGDRVAPRRVDLRPFVVRGGTSCWVLPGGLSRVALREGSYVVNSSQGGGSKDTWVLREEGS